MPVKTESIAVVILSFDRPKLLKNAIESCLSQTMLPSEIIVVDNPSASSAAIATLIANYQTVRLIKNAQNLGFAAGMNVGIRSAKAKYIQLMNDDIELMPDAIATATKFLEQNPSVGLLTGLLREKSSGKLVCLGGRVALDAIFKIEFIGQGSRDLPFNSPTSVDFGPGCFLFGASDLFLRHGGFYEPFFMYLEDVDLCLRVAESGGSVIALPTYQAVDAGPEVSNLDKINVHRLVNFFSIYLFHAKTSVLFAFFARYILWQPLKYLLKFERTKLRLHLRAEATFFRHFFKFLRVRLTLPS